MTKNYSPVAKVYQLLEPGAFDPLIATAYVINK